MTHGRHCPAHQVADLAAQRQATDARRGTSEERGYGAKHRRWRAAVLARDRFCVDPFGVHAHPRRVVPSTVADHKIPIRAGGARFDLANGQGLCASCHGRKTAEEDGGWGREVKGNDTTKGMA